MTYLLGKTQPEDRRVWTALSDDTRRRVFELLTDRPMAVGEVAARLPVTRPAVSQHLKVLKDAGLVEERRDGARRIYSVTPQGIAPLRDFVDRVWDIALDRFADSARTKAAGKSEEEGSSDG